MSDPIPFNRPFVAPGGLEYVARAVGERNLAGGGEFTGHCEAWLRRATGARAALLAHSGTGALEAATILAGVGPGDEVVMPSFGYPTMATAVVRQGGRPVFADIDPATLNVAPESVAAAVGPSTRALMAVHYGGVGCEMDRLGEIAEGVGAAVIEDAAHGILATRDEQPLGSIGDLGVLSFHETKNISCGEGGALLVNDPALVDRAEAVWEKGTDRMRFLRGQVDRYTWIDVGSSFAASELTAAFLLAQLESAEQVTARRRQVWDRYHEAFADLEASGRVRRPGLPSGCRHNGHTYYLILPSAGGREDFVARLDDRGVAASFHFVPLHSSPAGQRLGRTAGNLDVTSDLAARLVRLPLYPELDGEEVERVIDETRAAAEAL